MGSFRAEPTVGIINTSERIAILRGSAIFVLVERSDFIGISLSKEW